MIKYDNNSITMKFILLELPSLRTKRVYEKMLKFNALKFKEICKNIFDDFHHELFQLFIHELCLIYFFLL